MSKYALIHYRTQLKENPQLVYWGLSDEDKSFVFDSISMLFQRTQDKTIMKQCVFCFSSLSKLLFPEDMARFSELLSRIFTWTTNESPLIRSYAVTSFGELVRAIPSAFTQHVDALLNILKTALQDEENTSVCSIYHAILRSLTISGSIVSYPSIPIHTSGYQS